jgi:hypothetical protein
MTGPQFAVSCYNDFLVYVKAFTLQYVARRAYGQQIQENITLRLRLMAPDVGVIGFFHQLFHLVYQEAYSYMLSDIIQFVMPALVKESTLLECVTVPTFSCPGVRARCRTRILLLYISCISNVWEVLRTQDDGVRLSGLLASGSLNRYPWKTGSTYVKTVNTLHDTLFMGAIVRCMLNNEGYVTLMLFALTEHYERMFRGKHRPFTSIDKNSTLSAKETAWIRPLATIANEAMITVFGAWNGGTNIRMKSATGNNIVLHNEQCYAFALALYNMRCDMDGDGAFLWDRTLFSHGARQPSSRHVEHFLNEVNMLRVNVVDVFNGLDMPLPLSVAGPASTKEVMLSIDKHGFGKAVSVEFPLPRDANAHVNAFTKNKVVTLYMLCPRLRSVSCFNEAYTRETMTINRSVHARAWSVRTRGPVAEKVQGHSQWDQLGNALPKQAKQASLQLALKTNRRFVCHSNKISTGLGPCTFSLYKSQDKKGVGSCINTFNFHTSGNYLELCISFATVELDIMKANPKHMYPVTMPVKAQHNTCTTVDLPGLLNPETALSRAKMVWDPSSAPSIGPTKTTRFPACNVYVKYPNAVEKFLPNNLPPPQPLIIPGTKQPYSACDEVDGDNCDTRLSKKRRAYAVFDNNGIVCEQQRYTISQMKQMMKCSVSWELHRNNINTSYFCGDILIDRLQAVLSWYLGRDGVEFDPRKQNFIASVERGAHALLPFSVSFMAELQYLMRDTLIAAHLNVLDLFVSRSMICTYGGFSRGNAYMGHTSKNMYSYISTQHKLQGIRDTYRMNESVLCELVKREEMDMGQIRAQVEEFIKKKKKHMPLYSIRSRADGLVSSLIYGPEYFVRTFLETVPVLKALKLTLKEGECDSLHVASVLDKNYGKSHSQSRPTSVIQ